jgi:hypothetical protein
MTGEEKAITSIHSCRLRGATPNIAFRKGTYNITIWRNVEKRTAAIRYGLVKGVTMSSELSSDSALRALSISIITSTDRDRVHALTLPLVKYSQPLLEKSKPSKLLGWKPFQPGHSLQWESYCHVTREWPSPVSAYKYQ